MLGSEVDDNTFDTDIIIHINTALMDLTQIGVGPTEGFVITGDAETWEDFLGYAPTDDITSAYAETDSAASIKTRVEAAKTCVYLKVKLVFDPPETSALIASFEKQIERLEWRLNVQVETPRKEG